MKDREDLILKAGLVLFEDESLDKFSDKDQEIIKRYMAVHAKWLDNPMISDKKLIEFLKSKFTISQTQAYRDLANIKEIFGNIRQSNKELIRYSITESLKKAYNTCIAKGDMFNAINALNSIAKYNRLDQDDPDPIPYENIIPQTFEVTTDIKVFNPKFNDELFYEKLDKLKRKFLGEIKIEDAETLEDE
jgi:hypothetical protein